MLSKRLIFLVTIIPLIASQQVTFSISKNVAQLGDEVSFTCLSHIKTSSFILFHNEIETMGVNVIGPTTTTVANSDVRPNVVDRTVRNQQITFRMKRIEVNYAGIYSCQVIDLENKNNAVRSSKIELDVGFPPTSMKISFIPYDTLLTITCCYFNGKPGGEFRMLIENSVQKELVNDTTTTQIAYSKHMDLSAAHNKQITCTAKNKYGQTQSTETFGINFGPLMQYIYCNGEVSHNINVSRSTDLLECTAIAHPPAKAYWIRVQGSTLKFSLRDQIRQLHLNQFKFVKSAFQATCHVFNDIFPSGINKTFNVTFQEESVSTPRVIKTGSFFNFLSSEWSNYFFLTVFGIFIGIIATVILMKMYKRVKCQCCCMLQSSPTKIKNKTDGKKIYNMETFDTTYEYIENQNRQFSLSGPDGYMYPIESNSEHKYSTTF